MYWRRAGSRSAAIPRRSGATSASATPISAALRRRMRKETSENERSECSSRRRERSEAIQLSTRQSLDALAGGADKAASLRRRNRGLRRCARNDGNSRKVLSTRDLQMTIHVPAGAL